MTWRAGIDPRAPGVWRYAAWLGVDVPEWARVDVGVFATPVQRVDGLAEEPLWLLRDDLQPHGSHKDRGLCVQVAVCRVRGHPLAVVSSSGNAAISAAAACRVAGVRLIACLSDRTPEPKVRMLARLGATVVVGPRPVAVLRAVADRTGAADLRPSVDPVAPAGYRTIAFDVAASAVDPDAVFCFTTSGTTLCGIAAGLYALRARRWPVQPQHSSVRQSPSKRGATSRRRRRQIGQSGEQQEGRHWSPHFWR